MTKRNPKQKGSNLYDCKPQVGRCPINCNQCYYNRYGAYYANIHTAHMPSAFRTRNGIVRVNAGHDSNIQRAMVIKKTAKYANRFFNTSLPYFDFPDPVVFTANRVEEYAATCPKDLDWNNRAKLNRLMFVRLRVSSTNIPLVIDAAKAWAEEQIPVVLTFMAYYSQEPPADKLNCYVWTTRHINSYWCPTVQFMWDTLQLVKKHAGRIVTMCGTLCCKHCKNCRNCETYYWQTQKRMLESATVVSLPAVEK